MDFQPLYHNMEQIIPYIRYILGIFGWLFTLKITCLSFKKIIKDKIKGEYQEEFEKLKTDNIHSFMIDLINVHKYSSLIIYSYFISLFMAFYSVVAIFDSTKIFSCISYIILPIVEVIIFKTAKYQIVEQFKNNKFIAINKGVKEEISYNLLIK